MPLTTDRYRRGTLRLVAGCAGLSRHEKALVVADQTTMEAARMVAETAREFCEAVQFEVIPSLEMHGQGPPNHIGQLMLAADVIFCMTATSMAHTPERMAATRAGARFLSLPDYSLELLGSESLDVDFARLKDIAVDLGRHLKNALIRLTTFAGTDMVLTTMGRTANACPGNCTEPGCLASPPNAEVNIAPVECASNGVLVVDGSIPCKALGVLKSPIAICIRAGRVVSITGQAHEVDLLNAMFDKAGARSRVLAELGIGLNQRAKLTGNMLEDEGCAGTAHIGFGANSTIGGANDVPFHLDCVFFDPTITVNGKVIMEQGVPQLY